MYFDVVAVTFFKLILRIVCCKMYLQAIYDIEECNSRCLSALAVLCSPLYFYLFSQIEPLRKRFLIAGF